MANKMSQYKLILSEIEHTLNKVDEQKNIKFLDEILKANAIFVAAKGRSSFVANSFAMRLNQLGKRSYVVGETTTPSIQEDDLLLIVSGSGKTAHLQLLSEIANQAKANIILISTQSESKIAELSKEVITLPAGTKYDEKGSEQPLGSLFEQSSQIFLDSIIMELMKEINVSETTMQNNHANLE
ncbi:6-phospho-3-hexuloisomerase [Staphylococcus lentus]|nr:6-phospho-3-hexuloisomerase [Mammaliicoccus lentus]OAO18458.1 6-phospho 3-hexuloisomerase [Mammaliicoccus lentus]TFV13801.1 6-phospho-3-hexuloisomerase [Mammaliicoccus lentus]